MKKGYYMRTMTQLQALSRLPDDSMAKQIILKILNTPKPDYTAMKQKADQYEQELMAEMSKSDRQKLMEINSAK